MKDLSKFSVSILGMLFLLLTSFARAGGNDVITLEKQPLPKSPYIAEGACPYEGCHYGRSWDVSRTTPVYNSIGSKKILKTLKPGQQVRVLSGKIITDPTRIVFTQDYNGFKAGKEAYILEYLGESHTKIWYNQHVVSDNTLGCFRQKDAKQDDYCRPALKAAKVLHTGKSDWWVKIDLGQAKVGWARVVDSNLYASE
jgi:hypothetical protein